MFRGRGAPAMLLGAALLAAVALWFPAAASRVEASPDSVRRTRRDWPAWKFPKPVAPARPVATPRIPAPTLDALAGGEARCAEGVRRQLFVLGPGGSVRVDAGHAEALERFGERGRAGGGGDRWIRLHTLPGSQEAEALEVWPCQGDPIRIRQPDLAHWVVTPNQRGVLKLVDLSGADSRPALRNVAAIVVR